MRLTLLLILPLLQSFEAPGQEQAVGHPVPTRILTLDSCVNVFSPARIESTKAGYQYWFVGKDFLDGRTLKMSVVAPHTATHPPHSHPEDEFFFVLEGEAEFLLAGESRVVEGFASFYCPPDVPHGIRNAGDVPLKYLVIKRYPNTGGGRK